MDVGLPSLEKLCQEVLADEAAKYGSKKINELCKKVPSYLLEPILQSLLEKNQVTDVALNMFLVPSRTNLVMIGFIKIKNSTLKQIGYSCPNLLSLNLSDCAQLSNTVVRAVLQGCPMLEELRLDRCHRVTDAAFDVNQSPFEPLVGCLSLRTISLQGCPQVTGAIVATLNKSCVRLKNLNLSQCNQLETSAIQQLFEHNRLLYLNLSFVAEVTDEAFLSFPAIGSPSPTVNRRKFLNNSYGSRDNRDGNDAVVSLGGNRRGNNNRGRRRRSSLQVLHLAKSRITDKSMMKMAFLADLLEIHLQWCSGITDAGIAALVTGCLKLEIIDLKSCSITDLSIALIAKGSKELRSLDVSWCSNITDNGIKGLSLKDFYTGQTLASSILAARVPLTATEAVIGVANGVATAVATGGGVGIGGTVLGETVVTPVEVNTALDQGVEHGVSTVNNENSNVDNNIGSNSDNNISRVSSNNSSISSSNNNSSSTSHSNNHSNNNSSSNNHRVEILTHDMTRITENMYEIEHPSKLESLSVVWCLQLTDAALLSLAHLPKLKSVEATGCTGISEESVEKLTALGIKLVI